MDVLQRIEKHGKWIILTGVVLLVVLVISTIVASLPPRRFTLLTGREGGAYYEAAREYQQIAQENGFELEIRPTAGSVETLRLLKQGEAQIGFVQGGIALNADPLLLSSMASLFYEPVWVFYNPDRFDAPLTRLTQIEGKVFAIGEADSGASHLAREMLAANGMNSETTEAVEVASEEAARGLREGYIDAALFVSAPTSALIRELLLDPNLELMSFERAAAYTALLPYLTVVTLPQGAIDLRQNIPSRDTQLISTVANLVVSNDFHPDLLRLMTIAVVDTHEGGGLFEKRFEFPNIDHADLPIGAEERAYLERIRSGESTLDNYLPFWAAALIDRYLLFVLPVALVLLPIVSRSPMLITLYNKRKVTRWYSTVRSIDRSVSAMDVAEIDRALQDLELIEQRLREHVTVSENFMADYYNLRGHIDLVRSRLTQRRDSLLATAGSPMLAKTDGALPLAAK